ncbi:MAG TPA: TIGR04295 family B12-binding domain-containing radical SAM protein [Planctomycetota bacterium]|nr:TIGR04295 family B12-binding domain-containing radical SAM protein [Planctomycetota bacterium]
MRVALINPPWSFDGSIYFGCREPHLPLEFQYSKVLLERAGHEVLLVDGQLEGLSFEQIRARVDAFKPGASVVTTAPSYLFWRCAPPELRVPQQTLRAIAECGGMRVAVGPHGSTTPRATLRKLAVDLVIMGECEEVLPKVLGTDREQWKTIPSLCYADEGDIRVQGGPYASNMTALPALSWPRETVQRHAHHHHRFDAQPKAPGAEMEVSRGCPYHCTFCAKDNFRNLYRKRPLETVLAELDGLIENGIEYVYFIDEIFMPERKLLEALVERPVKFGVQMRIDLWSCDMLDLLGRAGCVSIEAGVESITPEGRQVLDKKCRMSTEELAERLIYTKKSVPFVQANLLESKLDDQNEVERWRQYLLKHGVWANKPVPLFPYPGSPDYTQRWGAPDDEAWERAHDFYLSLFNEFSDIQEERPRRLRELELSA